jgi:hypothetical protein
LKEFGYDVFGLGEGSDFHHPAFAGLMRRTATFAN